MEHMFSDHKKQIEKKKDILEKFTFLYLCLLPDRQTDGQHFHTINAS